MTVRIALDASGGDNAPSEIIKGALVALRELDMELTLVGLKESISSCISLQPQANIKFHFCSEKIEMSESPVPAVKKKKDSSICQGTRLVKEGKVDAFISAGNTGALMASALFTLGRLEGVDRPAITSIMPTVKGHCVMLDLGANADCKPKNLVQFAIMGQIFAEKVMHLPNPKVALLNIGEEAEKGNELCTTTYPLLKARTDLNFIGNIEPNQIYSGKADVIVADGFSGNIVLKVSEGVVETLTNFIKAEIGSTLLSKIGGLMLIPSFKRLKKKIDYDDIGGAIFLGVNGVVMKAHGRAKAEAIRSAIHRTWNIVHENILPSISEHTISILNSEQ